MKCILCEKPAVKKYHLCPDCVLKVEKDDISSEDNNKIISWGRRQSKYIFACQKRSENLIRDLIECYGEDWKQLAIVEEKIIQEEFEKTDKTLQSSGLLNSYNYLKKMRKIINTREKGLRIMEGIISPQSSDY